MSGNQYRNSKDTRAHKLGRFLHVPNWHADGASIAPKRTVPTTRWGNLIIRTSSWLRQEPQCCHR